MPWSNAGTRDGDDRTSAVVFATPFIGGRQTSALLADDVLCNSLDGIEVLRQEFAVFDRNAEGLLDESNHLEHPRRIDDTLIEQRRVDLQQVRFSDVEIRNQEIANLLSIGVDWFPG